MFQPTASDRAITFDRHQARTNMIEQQIRTWEVLDQGILDLMSRVKREQFVPEAYRNLAFADLQIPLDHGQVMMQPKLEGRLLQSLNLQAGQSVLEIGAGSGFVTACLAQQAGSLTSVDIHADFVARTQALLAAHGASNATLHTLDACGPDFMQGKRFDRIAVTGSLPAPRRAFEVLLEVGGRLFVILGSGPIMQATIVDRIGEREWRSESLFDTAIAALEHAVPPVAFEF